ncbi:MAG: hypothetical protein LiPW41_737 [Parcubacteria group bacterium LiPW_41]|nr:MAG: hypothetical protein LiPW41_737 [Parcubacteria group bacterium LiPW_41]
MRLQQTQKIMGDLRLLNRNIIQNKKIDEWVDEYINECILNGKPVEILLQWCSGLGLETRMKKQGGTFVPLTTEIDLIQKQIPQIINIFNKQNVRVSWIITFNRSYIKRRRLGDNVFFAYIAMIKNLANGIRELEESLLFFDWEELLSELKPNQKIITEFNSFVSNNAMEYEVKNFLQMLSQYPDSLTSKDEIREEAKCRIAFESEEAQFLAGDTSPFDKGMFILIPLERSERYIFFDLLVPEFTKRIVSVLKLYPWRMEN